MSSIVEIRCPACGSNDAVQLRTGKYKCNYCENVFEIKEEVVQENIRLEGEHQKIVNQTEKIGLRFTKAFFIFFGLCFVAFIGAFLYFGFYGSSNEGWKDKTLSMYKCFIGTNGPIIFKLLEQKSEEGDSVRYFTKTIDPFTEKVQYEMQIGTTMRQSKSADFLNSINQQFYCVNDTAYNYSKDSGLVGYNMYSFEQVLTSSCFKNKFPELKSGISNAVFYPEAKAFTLTAGNGKDYFYYPEDNKLEQSQTDSAQNDSIEVDTDLFLTLGKTPQLVSIDYDADAIDDALRISEDRAAGFNKKTKKTYEGDYGIYDLKKIENKIFYLGKVLSRYKDGLLILYAEDNSTTSKIVLEFIDKNGKTIWQNKSDLLQTLRNQATSEELFCDYTMLDDNLAISSSSPTHGTVGIDLKKGDTQWVFPSGKKN